MAWPAEQERQWRLFLAGLEASSHGFFLLEYDRLDTREALLRRLRIEFKRRQRQLEEIRLTQDPLEARLASTLREWPVKAVIVSLDGATAQQFSALNLARESLYDLPTHIVFLTSQETHTRFLTSARDLVTWINIPYSFALPKTDIPKLPVLAANVPPAVADRIQYYREQVQRVVEQDNRQEAFRLLSPLADLYSDAKMYNTAYQIYQALVTYYEQSADERQASLYVGRRDTAQGWRILADLAIPNKHYIPLPEDLVLLKKQLDEGMLSIQRIPDSPASSTPNTQPDKILIVTVTKEEAQAVLDVFSQAAGADWTRQLIGSKTYYHLGVHGGAPVFMVQSEMGTATLDGSLLTVRQAIQDLRPQAVIMCGIAFGLRPDKQKLGDILVAKQLGYYEPQKVDAQRGQMQRGDRVTASERLLRQFRSGDNDWQGAPTHFGLVLSGEKLVNDPAFKDWLLRVEPEAVGSEMEGVGLYVAAREAQVDWILVKAICDWADGTKHDNAQSLAACNAAQFVLHVLQLGGWGRPKQLHDFAVVDERGHTMPISYSLLATLGALSERAARKAVRTPSESRVRLYQNLINHFSVEELRTLCLELGVNYEDLPGESKKGKTREFVARLERHGRIPELVNIVSKLRPNVSWGDVLETTQ